MELETYSLEVECSNCGFSGIVDIEKGVKVVESICPLCECKNLIKKLKDNLIFFKKGESYSDTL